MSSLIRLPPLTLVRCRRPPIRSIRRPEATTAILAHCSGGLSKPAREPGGTCADIVRD